MNFKYLMFMAALLWVAFCPGARAEAEPEAQAAQLAQPAVDFVKSSHFYGNSRYTVGQIFERYKKCVPESCNWTEEKLDGGMTVIFTCQLPGKFEDEDQLPPELRYKLTEPIFTRILKAEFAVSVDNDAFALEYIGIGYGNNFYASNFQENLENLDKLLAQEDFLSTLKALGRHKETRSEFQKMIFNYFSSINVELPEDYNHWYFSWDDNKYYYIKLEDFTWSPGSFPDMLTGTAIVSMTGTDLTADAIINHLKKKRVLSSGYKKDLLGTLNANPEQIKDLAYTREEPRQFRYACTVGISDVSKWLNINWLPTTGYNRFALLPQDGAPKPIRMILELKPLDSVPELKFYYENAQNPKREDLRVLRSH